MGPAREADGPKDDRQKLPLFSWHGQAPQPQERHTFCFLALGPSPAGAAAAAAAAAATAAFLATGFFLGFFLALNSSSSTSEMSIS